MQHTSSHDRSFIGRDRELSALRDALAIHPLVTLVGPGGAGKTRLVRRHLEAHPGAFFADLSEARTREELLGVVASVLRVPPLGRGELSVRIGRALAARPATFLVLDNCEQLLAHAPLFDGWLDGSGGLRLLATSREPLGLAREHVIPLPPLESAAATRLLTERAREVRPGWIPDPREEAELAQLASHLDGNALALELAAARLDVLAPRELSARLGRRLDLLAARHGHPARHASLRAVLDGSWELLDEEARRALAACAVFAGSFPASAAEAVLGGGEALAAVQSLCRASLLRTSSDGGALRLFLGESVAAYAQERLAERPDREALEDRHAAWCLASFELENAVAAAERTLERAPATGCRLVLAAADALAQRGRHERLVRLLERALLAAERCGDDELLARVLLARLEDAVFRQGRAEVASELERALALARAQALLGVEARLLHVQAILEGRRGDPAAQETLALALVAARTARDPLAEATTHRLLAARELERGGFEAMRRHLEEAWELCRTHGLRELLGRVLYNLGIVETLRGRKDAARDFALEAQRVHRELGNRLGESDAIKFLGTLLLDANREDEAFAAFEDALAISRDSGDRVNEAIALRWMGDVELSRGRLVEAEDRYRSAAGLHREVDEPRMEGFVHVQLALVALERGALGEAEGPLTLAEGLFERVGDPTGRAVAACYRGVLEAGRERADLAQAAFARARALLDAVGGRHWLPMAEAFEGHLDLARARAAECAGDSGEAAKQKAIARARLVRAVDPGEAYLGRVARRSLERALSRISEPAAVTLANARRLGIAVDGRAFQVAGGERVDLVRRRSLRLLLLTLAAAHRDHPDRALTLDELLEAGWPGEKVLPEAGARRVYVAISTLRGLGLQDALLTRDDGYLLDARLTVERF